MTIANAAALITPLFIPVNRLSHVKNYKVVVIVQVTGTFS